VEVCSVLFGGVEQESGLRLSVIHLFDGTALPVAPVNIRLMRNFQKQNLGRCKWFPISDDGFVEYPITVQGHSLPEWMHRHAEKFSSDAEEATAPCVYSFPHMRTRKRQRTSRSATWKVG